MLTIYDYFGYNIPKKERYRLIKEAGFGGVAVWWGNDFGDENYLQNPNDARAAGLVVENMHTPFDGVNNFWIDNINGTALLDKFIGIVDDCAQHSIPAMVVHLSSGYTPPPCNEIGLDRIKRIIDRAEKYGVNVAFENLSTTRHLEYVLDKVKSSLAGFCYDSGHHNCWAADEEFMKKYGSRLMELHLHDNDGNGDQHLLPFDGTCDWPVIMGEIAKAGFTGSIALEAMNFGYERILPFEFLTLAFERAKRLESLFLHAKDSF